MANFILLKSLKPVQREIVAAELKLQAAKLRFAHSQGRGADYEKYQDQAYGYSQALAQMLAISWFTVTDEINTIWNPGQYAARVSKEAKYQAGLKQTHYANGTVAFMVMAKIKAESTDAN